MDGVDGELPTQDIGAPVRATHYWALFCSFPFRIFSSFPSLPCFAFPFPLEKGAAGAMEMPVTIRTRHRKRSSRSSDGARMKEGKRSWGGRAGRGEGPCFSATSPLQSPREPTRSPSIPSIEQGFWSFTCRGVPLTCCELRPETRRGHTYSALCAGVCVWWWC
ncbi:hypothetical protein LZ30DRAFT_122081 [Colletotrichum cereale]|nr:hypothetical protein LZ30DRAFT_122081 [Colletotrichum cereale]